MDSAPKFHLHDGAGGAAIWVHVSLWSEQARIEMILSDGTVQVGLPVQEAGSQANQALIRYLAEVLQIPASSIEIMAGEFGPDKLLTFLGINSDTANRRILQGMGK